MDKPVEISIQFDYPVEDNSYPLGTAVSGQIIVQPKVNLNPVKIGYSINLQSIGQKVPWEETLQHKTYLTQGTLTKDETYTYPFNFENDQIETYQGVDASYIINLEAYVTHPSVYKIKIDAEPDVVKQHQRQFEDHLQIRQEEYIQYVDPNQRQVRDVAFSFQEQSYLWVGIGLGIFLFFFCLMLNATLVSKPMLNLLISMLVGAAPITIFTYSYYIGKKRIGEIHLRIDHASPTHFNVSLAQSEDWTHIKSLELQYMVTEYVVDSRGLETTIERKNHLFKSVKKRIKQPKNLLEFSFPYPPKDFPNGSIDGDIKVNWELILKVTTIKNLNYTYKRKMDLI